MRRGTMKGALTTDEITKSLAYLVLYFSSGVAVSTAITLGASTVNSSYGESMFFYAIFGSIVALVLSALVGLCVIVFFSPLTYTLGRQLSAKLTWRGTTVAYFGFATLAATATVVGGLPLAPVLGGQPAEWNPGAFFAAPGNSLVAAAIILIAGLSAAAACATIRRSSLRAIRGAE